MKLGVLVVECKILVFVLLEYCVFVAKFVFAVKFGSGKKFVVVLCLVELCLVVFVVYALLLNCGMMLCDNCNELCGDTCDV